MRSPNEGRARRRPRGVPIRPGSVAEARLAAGLTCSQLAAGAMSRQQAWAIETGRARPSLRSLRRIAEATGKPLAWFLSEEVIAAAVGVAARGLGDAAAEPGLHPAAKAPAPPAPPAPAAPGELRELEVLETLALQEEWTRVVALGSRLAGQLRGGLGAATASWQVGRAHLQLGDGRAALPHLERARRAFVAAGDGLMAVEAMHQEFVARWQLHDPGALPLAEQTLHLSRQLEPRAPPVEARVLLSLAELYAGRGCWKEVVACYEAALAAAEPVSTLHGLGRMYLALEEAYRRQGLPDRASHFAHQAIAAFGRQNDLANLARAEGSLGALLLRQGDLAAARRQLESGLAHLEEAGVERSGKVGILRGLGELQLSLGQPKAAERWLASALALAERLEEPEAEAQVHRALARLHGECGERAAAQRELELAIGVYARLGASEALRECHFEYATLLLAQQATEAAVSHLILAAGFPAPPEPSPAALQG
jgi:tetratricopeptide (TPR) repeat protein